MLDFAPIDSVSEDIEDEVVLLPVAVHQSLSCNEILADPDAMKAVRKEAAGLSQNRQLQKG